MITPEQVIEKLRPQIWELHKRDIYISIENVVPMMLNVYTATNLVSRKVCTLRDIESLCRGAVEELDHLNEGC